MRFATEREVLDWWRRHADAACNAYFAMWNRVIQWQTAAMVLYWITLLSMPREWFASIPVALLLWYLDHRRESQIKQAFKHSYQESDNRPLPKQRSQR